MNRATMLTVGAIFACGIAVVHAGTTLAFSVRWLGTAVGLLFGMALAWDVLRNTGPKDGPYLRTVVLGFILGPIGSILLFVADARSSPPGQGSSMAAVVIVSAVVGLILGPLFALVTVPLTIVARDWRSARTLDTPDRALAIYGSILLFLGLGLAFLQAEGQMRGGERGWDGVIACAISVTLFAPVLVHDLGRRRWLRALLASELSGWSVVDAVQGDETLPRYLNAAPGQKVITRALPPANDGPFRVSHGAPAERIASLDPAAAIRVLTVRLVLTSLAITIALAIIAISATLRF